MVLVHLERVDQAFSRASANLNVRKSRDIEVELTLSIIVGLTRKRHVDRPKARCDRSFVNSTPFRPSVSFCALVFKGLSISFWSDGSDDFIALNLVLKML